MPPTMSRRERLRAQTLAEIQEHAFAQVDAGGLQALSLNAIAKAMGMSGPALYRYHSSRDELLGALIAEGYADITRAVEEAVQRAARSSPARRLGAVASTYRGWALAHPRRFAMLFGERPEGFTDPAEAIAVIQGSMEIILELLLELGGKHATDAGATRDRLDRELIRWAKDRRRYGDMPSSPRILRLGVLTWTRIHGIVSLELAGAFASMELDAGRLLEAEIAGIVEMARG